VGGRIRRWLYADFDREQTAVGAGIKHRELSLAYVRDLLVAREDFGDGDHRVHNEIGMLNVA
jgi:hypothetical protein